MPPKQRPQLQEDEIALIHWWIASGASFNKKVKELQQPEKIKPVLTALQNMGDEKKMLPDIPVNPVEKADEASIKKLQDSGVIILPVSQNSNYLSANFVTASRTGDDAMKLLLPLKKQLVWLKLGNTAITDKGLAILSGCTNLTRLQLDHTNITDKGLAELKKLHDLRYLNLVATKVTTAGILQLKDLKNLHSIYVYQTGVSGSGWADLIKAFPHTLIDSGGYTIPFIATDTVEVKPPKLKQ